MLKPKIRINKYITSIILEDRQKANKSGVELSKEIGKSESWCSLLENGRMKSVSSKDLINIFKILHSFTDQEAEQYIEDFLNEFQKITQQKVAIYRYDEKNEFLLEENFTDILETIIGLFNSIYDNNSKYAFECLNQFMKNLQFDIGFILALNKIPFNILKDTDHETRKELFDEISNVVKNYFEKYSNNLDDIESNKKFIGN